MKWKMVLVLGCLYVGVCDNEGEKNGENVKKFFRKITC